MKLQIDQISTDQLGWTPEHNQFSAYISDLSRAFNPLKQIWDDACDVGFELVSARTGAVVVFTLERTDKDRDREVAGWKFRGFAPGFDHLKVLLIND